MLLMGLLEPVLVWYASRHGPCLKSGLMFTWQVFSPASVIFAGVGVLLLVRTLLYSFVRVMITPTSQAAKDTRASQDTLIDIFERIETFFRRLEIYTEVPSTMEMMDIIIQIMVEVLSILGIATREVKQGRLSRCLLYRYDNQC
jgi:Na+-transporting methylmalonyl-CoA/oxaloacetate decarboxylase gamma subunit